MIELINKYGFIKSQEKEYTKDNWTLRIDFPNFELFSDPEIDTRYYIGSLDNLEKYLLAIQ